VHWTPARLPIRGPLPGSYVLARPFLPDADAQPLYAASHPPEGDIATWTYLPDGPYENAEQLRGTLAWALAAEGAVYFALAPLRSARRVLSRVLEDRATELRPQRLGTIVAHVLHEQ
jgi:hypothetical protein